MECETIDGRNTDSEVGNYWVNRNAANDYRYADRTEDCDGPKAFSKTNSTVQRQKWMGDKTGWPHLGIQNKFTITRKKRFRNNDRRNISEKHRQMWLKRSV